MNSLHSLMFKIAVPIEKIFTGHQEIRTVYHNGIQLKLTVEIKKNASTTVFASYVSPTLDSADEKLEVVAKLGFINGNDNMCRESKFTHTFIGNTGSGRGLLFYTTHDAAELAKVPQYYDVNGTLIFGILFENLSVECNNNNLLRRIYHSVKGDTIAILETQIAAQVTMINDLLTTITRLEKQIEDAPAPAPAMAVPVSSLPLQSQTFNNQLDVMDISSLRELQKKLRNLSKFMINVKFV